jgi:hypothetical protein
LLTNESSRLQTDLERSKENNATILTENIRMIEDERQSVELSKKVVSIWVNYFERRMSKWLSLRILMKID